MQIIQPFNYIRAHTYSVLLYSYLEMKSFSTGNLVYQAKSNCMDIQFQGGVNIAIKIPKSKYEKTVAFYRDILKLEVTENRLLFQRSRERMK